jgi:hypothetical protein
MGLELVVKIVAQYDYEILLSSPLIVCNKLTLAPIKAEVASHVLLTLGIFGSLVSTKKKLGHGASHNKGVIFFVQPNTMKNKVFNPLKW